MYSNILYQTFNFWLCTRSVTITVCVYLSLLCMHASKKACTCISTTQLAIHHYCTCVRVTRKYSYTRIYIHSHIDKRKLSNPPFVIRTYIHTHALTCTCTHTHTHPHIVRPFGDMGGIVLCIRPNLTMGIHRAHLHTYVGAYV